MKDTFFLTTAIDYTNAAPHIGHAYEKILADCLARAARLEGQKVFFLTGVDQHGQKVQQSAAAAGVAPADFARAITAKFQALWEMLGIAYDGWAATTDPAHTRCVQEVLARLHREGQITKAAHVGHYSVRQEQFLTDKDRGPDGSFGPEWGEVMEIEEENYYFRLSEHREWLLAFVANHPDFVQPAFRMAELRNALGRTTGDLCISRPKTRLAWGIELPFDTAFVTYVWFDALLNYISFAGYADADGVFATRWPADRHVIGKDILVPAHGVYWPAMLHALGFPDEAMPRLLVHGYINAGGDKMSKSLGNVVDPSSLVQRHGAGALRYYLLRETVTGQDMEFSEERLVARVNADLANGLGNLLNRTLTMAAKYREGRLRQPAGSPLAGAALAASDAARAAYMRCEPHAALEAAAALVTRCNAYVEETAPWKLAKDPGAAARLDEVLYSLAEAARIAAILHCPAIPDAAIRMLAQLGIPSAPSFPQTAWGGLPDGHQLGTPEPVFPRLEVPTP
jgi:methionyl-tRNA synthetase